MDVDGNIFGGGFGQIYIKFNPHFFFFKLFYF